jgi:hypothetical protein
MFDSLPTPSNPDDELFMQRVLRHLDDLLDDQETSELYAELLGSKSRRRQFVTLHMRSVGLSELLRPQLAVDPEESTPLTLDDAQILPALTPSDETAAVDVPADVAARAAPEIHAGRTTSGSIWHKFLLRGNAQQRGVRWASAAAVLIASGIALIIILRQLGMLGTPVPQPLTLGASLDVLWANPAAAPASGTILDNGVPQSLSSGYVELTSPNGLTAVIQGPASFTVQRAGVVALHSGRMTAIVPRNARGFTVNTPVSSIVDLGTEFGVSVGSDGATDVETFRGTVSVSPSTTVAVGSADSVLINAGSARRVDLNGAVTEIPPNGSAFVRPQQFEDWSAFTAKTPYDRWKAYSERLRHDPDLVAYYTFSNATDTPDRLLNQSAVGPALDGILGGDDPTQRPEWTTGRWPQKGGLAFVPGEYSHVIVHSGIGDALDFSNGDQTARPFTIAGWICVNSAPADVGGIVAKGFAFAEQFAIDLHQSLDPRAWVRDSVSTNSKAQEALGDPLPLGSWIHLAMTCEPGSHDIKVYLNGRVSAERNDVPGKLLRTDSPVTIGARPRAKNDDGSIDYYQPFEGRMDELAIFRRVISADQVREMYLAGKPN